MEKEKQSPITKIANAMKIASPTEKYEIKKEIQDMIDFAIEDKRIHDRPSPETIKMFEQVSKNITAMQEHLERQDKNFEAFEKTMKPISETFNTGVRIKKWGWGLLMVISVTSGLIWGWFNFLKPFIQKMV